MTIVLLFKGDATKPFVLDLATGTDSAVILNTQQFKSTSDQAIGNDVSSLVVPAPPAGTEILPKLTLQISHDAPAGPIYKEAVTTAPAEVYYRLNETSGPAIDSAGNTNLTVVGGVTRNQATMVSGEASDRSYDFNGTTGYLRGVDNAALDGNEVTLEVLIRPDSVTGVYSIMRRITTVEADIDIWGLRIIDGRLNLFVTDINDIVYRYWSTRLLAINTEYHVMCTMRENQIEFYVDGLLSDFIPKSWVEMKKSRIPVPEGSPEGTLPTFLSTELIIGAGPLAGGVLTEFFDGRIDEPAVFTFALPTEAAAYHHMARTAPTSYTWTTISTDTNSQVKDFSVKVGRPDIFRETETGLLTAILENQDRAFDPSYSGSPFYPNLRPAMPLRCIATKDGVSYDLFRGDIEDWPQDWQGRQNEVPLNALDALSVLASASVVVTSAVELTGARIHAILDAAAWPRELRDIDTGSSYVQAWEDESGKAKDLISQVVLAESGHMYVDGRGFVVFRSRVSRFNSAVAVTFSNVPSGGELPLSDAEVVEDKDQIYNDVRITVAGRDTHVAQDPASVLEHRKRSLELTMPLEDNTEGFIKAHWLLQLYKEPFTRIREVVIEPQLNTLMWQHALGRKIGDRVRFKIYPPGPGSFLQLEAHIEHIAHRQIVGRWTTVWTLSPADINQYWILGTSVLGVDTKLAY